MNDHNRILFRFTRRGNLTPSQYKAQMLLTEVSDLQTIQTAGTNLTAADMLSRHFVSNTVTYIFLHTPLDSLSLQSVTSFLKKLKNKFQQS